MINSKQVLMVAALLMGTAGAMAGEPPADAIRIQSEEVRFDDLDLASRAGVSTLHWRLRIAANNTCSGQGVGLAAHQQERKCRAQSFERALAAVPAVVMAYHAEWKGDGANWLSLPVTQRGQLAASR
jgi:UrcA family protein